MPKHDISSFISAVKPRERTDQYLILAALFVLNAQATPIAAREVTQLLRLHLGARTPANVNASLRAYSAYVSPAQHGPPILWKLTERGVEKLRQLSGLPLIPEAQPDSWDYDIGIICALEQPEFAAVVDATGGSAAWNEVGDARYTHVYREATLSRPGGAPLRLIGTTATSMGLTAAAIATTQLAFQFRPRVIVMTGIAAGTRASGKEYGDVLVADPSVDYNSGKVVQAQGIREFQPDPYPIGLNPRMRSLLQKYRGKHHVFDDIRSQWTGQLPGKGNRMHLGPLGAADQVIDDASRVIEIQKNWRKLIGVEMETYGVYRAVNEAPEPKPRAVSLKSVCDFAAEKTDSWQDYAAFVSARFAMEFFRREWDALWPPS